MLIGNKPPGAKAPRPKKKESQTSESSNRDSFKENAVQFGLGALPVVGTLANGIGTTISAFGTMIGMEDTNFGTHFGGTLANVGGTAALAAGLASGVLPYTVAGAGLLALSGLAFARS